MIPPAEGLNEKQLGLLVHIINECAETPDGYLHCTYLMKSPYKDLCQFGVIGVATVTFSHWQSSPRTPFTTDGWIVWVTEKGHQYMRGEIDVAKPCTLERDWKYGFYTINGICKRHKIRHTREDQLEAFNSTSVS